MPGGEVLLVILAVGEYRRADVNAFRESGRDKQFTLLNQAHVLIRPRPQPEAVPFHDQLEGVTLFEMKALANGFGEDQTPRFAKDDVFSHGFIRAMNRGISQGRSCATTWKATSADSSARQVDGLGGTGAPG